MGAWNSYESRLSMRGSTKREAILSRTKEYFSRKLPASLSYHTVDINGLDQNLAIINSDNLNQKTLCSMPGEDIISGSLIYWQDSHWLVTETDINNEVYTKATMIRCNHLLKWIAADGRIIERWCIISDGTKYLTGETISSYNENGMSLGDTRISVSLARDEYTVQLGRDFRFLIDDEDSGSVLAYRLTKPFKIGGVYDSSGVMSFVMTEVNTEDDDNFELHIADYYKHFPRDDGGISISTKPGESVKNGKKVWL